MRRSLMVFLVALLASGLACADEWRVSLGYNGDESALSGFWQPGDLSWEFGAEYAREGTELVTRGDGQNPETSEAYSAAIGRSLYRSKDDEWNVSAGFIAGWIRTEQTRVGTCNGIREGEPCTLESDGHRTTGKGERHTFNGGLYIQASYGWGSIGLRATKEGDAMLTLGARWRDF